MDQILLAGKPDISVFLRRSARARQLSLRLSQLDGRVTVTAPHGVSERQIRTFLLDKEGWLRRHMDRLDGPVRIGLGGSVPLEGRPREICATSGRRLIEEADRLLVPGPADRVAVRLKAWLRERARLRLIDAVDCYAQALGKPYSKITLRDTRSRWGSCTADGALMFSWRLILAPHRVLDYVAAHEVAHLSQMNHSPAFWAVVEELYGEWREERDWLKTHGATLHRYRFDD